MVRKTKQLRRKRNPIKPGGRGKHLSGNKKGMISKEEQKTGKERDIYAWYGEAAACECCKREKQHRGKGKERMPNIKNIEYA